MKWNQQKDIHGGVVGLRLGDTVKWYLTLAPRLSETIPSSKAEWVSTWGGIPVVDKQ